MLSCEEKIIYEYFDLLSLVIVTKRIRRGREYNMDEAGFGKKLPLRYIFCCGFNYNVYDFKM